MDSGLYTAAIGMLNEFNVEDSISNNLANMQTPGYKERSAVQQDFSSYLMRSDANLAGQGAAETVIGRFGEAPSIANYGLNLAQGNPRRTGSQLDLMIAGNGFFSVRAGNKTLLTRNGSFQRSAQGELRTAEGYAVLGADGRPIKLPAGQIEIDQRGTIRVNGNRVGQLGLAQVPTGRPLTESGDGYYIGPGQPLRPGTRGVAVLQGYLESSNVDLATQTSAMLSAQRAYQADSRMLQIQDDTLGLAVNDLGKVS